MTDLLAYISSALPLLYLPAESASSFAALASTLLAIAGFTISTLALLDLGTSFGVAPANRGIVRSGLYRYLRHPMYAGYVIAEVGFVLLNPVNAVILAASFFFYILRAKLENRIFD
ncbi:MAG TPA: isoprenylcysteine carboxylmethyltransferase family protein [Bacteriovoracaceae bacterium]|nr:isoprenylcysteine carboxylmethyltransferase family protein [Bacteriovoracaceae bacterium]